MSDNTNDIAEDFSQHVLLYAKGHYGRSGDIIRDLKVLLEKYAMIGDPSDNDVKHLLVSAYIDYGCKKEHIQKEALLDIIGWKWPGYPFLTRTPEQVMIGQLAIAEGKFVNLSKKFPDIHFGKITC